MDESPRAEHGCSPPFAVDEVEDGNPHIEPVHASFVCPMTKEVMRDPVTLENGQTIEREAIEDWFEECAKKRRSPTCPLTSTVLQSSRVYPNTALKETIEEWANRNELAQLKLFCSSITLGSSESHIIKGLNYLEYLFKEGRSRKEIVSNPQIVSVVTGFLTNDNRNVRCKALGTLTLLSELQEYEVSLHLDVGAIRTIVKFLRQDNPQERQQAVVLLYELSRSQLLCEMIGQVKGAVLILIGISGSTNESRLTSLKAERTLKNLEVCKGNVRLMAENGRIEPLLRLLLEGSPETQNSMAECLGGLILSENMKLDAAQTAGQTLLDILRRQDMEGKAAALRALNAISSCESGAKLLMQMGALPALMEELFSDASKAPVIKAYSAATLAKLIASVVDFQSIFLDDHSSTTLLSQDTIRNLLRLTSGAVNVNISCNVLRVLSSLTKSLGTVQHVVAAIRTSGATTSLTHFIDNPTPQMSAEAIQVLQNISPFMGKELAIALSRSDGLTSLVRVAFKGGEVTEEKASAIGLLAELPDDEPELVQSLLRVMAFESATATLRRMVRGKITGTRSNTLYLEGLVRVVSKLTYVPTIVPAAEFSVHNQLAVLFTDLLELNGLENVHVISAKALGNLSLRTRVMSRVPKGRRNRSRRWLYTGFNKVFEKAGFNKVFEKAGFNKVPGADKDFCKVHGGRCSLKTTFCIADGRALRGLVSCLERENEKLVEAALTALCTLLDDEVDVGGGALALDEAMALGPILNILTGKHGESIHRRAIWAVERLLRTESIALLVNVRLNVRSVLVEAFKNGRDLATREIAENALKLLDVLPDFSLLNKR